MFDSVSRRQRLDVSTLPAISVLWNPLERLCNILTSDRAEEARQIQTLLKTRRHVVVVGSELGGTLSVEP